ncbi:MAG: hypothetical protein QME51_07045 [Planctomycetota bacterium]|nr:hypothetical protein [Planctomycetota bacterium]
MTRIQQTVIWLILLFVFNGGCSFNSVQPPKDPELIKRVNEILDMIDEDVQLFLSPIAIASHASSMRRILMRETEAKFLIENPDISLPLMFERLDNKKVPPDALGIYFLVFEKVKSAESIPYIADYIASVVSDDEWTKFAELTYTDSYPQDAFGCAIFAAYNVTRPPPPPPFKLIDQNRTLYEQRLDIANKLNQWYKDYRNKQGKK